MWCYHLAGFFFHVYKSKQFWNKSSVYLKIKILYGDTLHDHIPIYCEIAVPHINSEINLQDQHSEKYHVKWNNISGDQKTLYSDNLGDLAIEIRADVPSCHVPFCDDPSHHRQLNYTYSALI